MTRAPSRAAVSAAKSPAAPAPTTTRSDRTRQHGITVCAMEESSRRALWLRDDDVFAHDVPGHPERPARIRALEAEMSAHGWFGVARVAGAGGRALACSSSCTRRRTSRSIEELCAAGGGAIDADTFAVPGTYGAALRAARRGGGAGRRAAGWRGRGGRERAAPARASRRGGAGDGVLLLRQRRRRGAAGDVGARALAGDDRRLGRPPRQRHQRHLPRGCRRAVRLASTSRRCIRGPGRRPTSGSGAGEGFTVNLPVPGGQRRRGLPLAGRARGVRADPRRGSRSSC